MPAGADRPGRITRLPGGVALNIAMTLQRFGVRPGLLSVVGRDMSGDALLARCEQMGLDVTHVLRHAHLPTDRYMAIEDPSGLIAAIADAHTLEDAGDDILAPLIDGRLGAKDAPFAGALAVDGNLIEPVLDQIANEVSFRAADLRIVPASPGKALRLMPFVSSGRGVLYVNLEEAGLLCGGGFLSAPEAARALVSAGAARALVTNGAHTAADATADACQVATPPQVQQARVTGAGDTFMAAHIAAELAGIPSAPALESALKAAAAYVSGKDTI